MSKFRITMEFVSDCTPSNKKCYQIEEKTITGWHKLYSSDGVNLEVRKFPTYSKAENCILNELHHDHIISRKGDVYKVVQICAYY